MHSNNEMILKTDELRLKLIEEGKRDEMKMMNGCAAPDLKVGMRTQHVFKCTDDDMEETTYEWCTGTIVELSNGKNFILPSETGPSRYHRKGSAANIRWDDNALSAHETDSFSVVSFAKTLFNVYKDKGWRVFYDMPWNNLPLQSILRNEEIIHNNNETTATTANQE